MNKTKIMHYSLMVLFVSINSIRLSGAEDTSTIDGSEQEDSSITTTLRKTITGWITSGKNMIQNNPGISAAIVAYCGQAVAHTCNPPPSTKSIIVSQSNTHIDLSKLIGSPINFGAYLFYNLTHVSNQTAHALTAIRHIALMGFTASAAVHSRRTYYYITNPDGSKKECSSLNALFEPQDKSTAK